MIEIQDKITDLVSLVELVVVAFKFQRRSVCKYIYIYIYKLQLNSKAPFYMEKSCPGQEGHPPSRVNLTERLYEKKVDPFARAKS